MKNISLGEFLRALRLERGMTQETLAARADIAAASLSSVERDKHQPQEATSARLLDALRVAKELSLTYKHYATTHMRLPDDYTWEAPDSATSLTWEHIAQDNDHCHADWINHCVRELAQQMGQEGLLDALLTLARVKGLNIPKSPSLNNPL